MEKSSLIEIVNYKGKQIMFWRFPDGISQQELVEITKSHIEFSRTNTQFKHVITDFSNVHVGREFMQTIKENADVFDKLKSAPIGISGLKKVLLTGFSRVLNKQIRPFDAKEEALEYLARD